ncbi:hypothetical protein E2C01_083867 [Portunus trituberculatus]|uniref:Uncharacterized protein n=1 Tax=Portunus trituberculatus TaxID=210409 RepID=A0A5B7IY77_PORTR|nr:hypothetical protein [Portunus trituberculatus]
MIRRFLLTLGTVYGGQKINPFSTETHFYLEFWV